ncbi:MAG: hypothetical protein ACREV9_08840 [Burkholderiales bacterium]
MSFKKLFVVLIAAFSLALPVHATHEAPQAGQDPYEPEAPPSGSSMLVDIVIARPLGLLATVVGAAAWVVSLPFSLPSGSADEAAEALIKEPAAYTFKRPLGEIPDCRFEDPYGERHYGERHC